jgi:hypothetical protein
LKKCIKGDNANEGNKVQSKIEDSEDGINMEENHLIT